MATNNINNDGCAGCLNGRTIIVDPNKVKGQSSTNNLFVSTEELSILVDLETTKKNRSIITVEGNKAHLDNTNNDLNISFFRGNQNNKDGSTSYTTRYTDLNTNFDNKQKDFESLGITNISIDFSSSYAPLITINFIDVRGSSLFQRGNDSPYNVFFQLPYPIFQLTIKGYYGQAVTYCLHLTKFNSKFNSSTGNFEITANFIGYTYAMLSDMLIGYLRAITKTDIGLEKFNKIKQENNDSNLITINELLINVSKVNQSIDKLSTDDKQIVEIESAKNATSSISILRDSVIKVIDNLSTDKGTFITTNNNMIYLKLPASPATSNDIQNFKNDKQKILDTYNDNIKESLNTLNEVVQKQFQLTESDFNPIIYENIIKSELEPLNENTNTVTQLKKNSKSSEIFDNAFLTLVKQISDVLKLNNISEIQPVIIYDFSNVFNKIQINETKINNYDDSNKKELANKLKAIISDPKKGLGIEPTIKNLFNILTTHVEVFLDSIYEVSKKASNNPNRDAELKNLIGSNLDIQLGQEIYPWPEYRKPNTNNGGAMEEAWLGRALNNWANVPEVKFVEDLLKALLEVAKEDETFVNSIEQGQKTWYPINPFDTKLFLTENPYNSIKNTNNFYDIYKLMLFRAITYLGISNNEVEFNPNNEEIKIMARLEANNVNSIIMNEKIKDAATQTDKDNILNFFKGKHKEIESFDGQIPFLVDSGDKTYYEYIFKQGQLDSSGNPDYRKYIPISGNKILNNGEFFYLDSKNTKPNLTLFNDNGGNDIQNLYLGNYTKSTKFNKDNDGATYLKIITLDKFTEQDSPPSDIGKDGNGIIGEVGKDGDGVVASRNLYSTDFSGTKRLSGLDLFGGRYGIQEFTNINYSETGDNSQMYTLFYTMTNGLFSSSLGFPRKNLDNFKYSLNNKQDFFRVELIGENNTDIFENYESYGKNRELSLITSKASLPYINFSVLGNGLLPISLFGSRLYFEQKTDEAKAFLFLHTFPWTGLFNFNNNSISSSIDENNQNIFNTNAIRNLFAHNASFIQVPKLWAAFIGSLLWRYDPANPSSDKIGFKNITESFLPTDNLTSIYPTNSQYLTVINSIGPMQFGGKYKNLDDVLRYAPQQVKDEFINIFNDFVQGEWQQLKSKLEISNDSWTSSTDWKNAWSKMVTNIELVDEETGVVSTQPFNTTKNYQSTVIKKTDFNTIGFKNTENYSIFSPLQFSSDDIIECDETTFNESSVGNMKYNYFLELKQNTAIMTELLSLYSDTVYIANGTYRIWNSTPLAGLDYSSIGVDSKKLEIYVDTFINEFKSLNAPEIKKDDRDLAKQKIFSTMDDDTIKLNIYRTIKSIYDKWIGGSQDNDIIFQCGTRNNRDTEIANKDGRGTPRLIDSFRFIDRAFSNIGDKFFINPMALADIIKDNPNQSFYDLIGRTLADNNFDFVALPAYIDYSDCNALSDVFKTYTYNQAIKQGTSGPSFVCVYVGQTSNKLDLGKDALHSNDGFDFNCDNLADIPSDFANNNGSTEQNLPVFIVNYGQQNQNIFKDIRLDQQEFTETEESLKITDSIAQKGSQNNQTLAGQNLFNVYQTRSYKAEIDMMGNAMIQPMMYFQLNNIPMFHGAYLITKVKHILEPNNMSTTFTGVRIKKSSTPLIDSDRLYMSLLGALTKSDTLNKNTNSVPLGTTRINGSDSQYSNFITYEVKENSGLLYQPKITARYTIKEVGEFFELISTTWNTQSKTQGFKSNILYVNDLSNYHGGPLSPHQTHQRGTSVDIRPMRTDDSSSGIVITSKEYDQNATIAFITLLLDTAKKTTTFGIDGKDIIKNIYFNDKVIITKFQNYFGDGRDIVKFVDGHSNHLHLEFNIPKSVDNAIKNGETQGELNPDRDGQAEKIANIPSLSERLKSLGNI